jgi:glycosyltransferase involved in cell wall biosynthesis
MTKILYDHQIFSSQEYGGVSRYFYEISKRINQSLEFDVQVLAPMYFNEYLSSDNDLVKGVYLPCIPKVERLQRKLQKEFNNILSKLILNDLKPDVIHETYYQKNSISMGKIPIITTVYDMIHEKFTNNFSGRNKTSELKKIAVSRANHIICISENTKRDLIEVFNVPEEKISVVYLGFSFKDDNSSVKSLLEKPHILYVGKRGKYKNFERLLKTFSLSPTLIKNFVLVAFGGGKFRPEEQKNIRELGLDEDNITQMSGSDEVLKNLYKNATAFIYPSLYEGFGIPPLEAMSLNCPVICSRASSIPEVVGDAGQYFDPFDIDDMQSAIEKVIESESLKQDLIARGQKQLTKFSWDLCAEQTAQIYHKVLS